MHPSNIESASHPQLTLAINSDCWDFADFVLKARFSQALEDGISRYPIHRSLRFAARLNLTTLFDELALSSGWTCQRLRSSSMILTTDQMLISAHGGRKEDYCSCSFDIWAADIETAENAKQSILDRVGDTRIEEAMFSIDWHFLTSKGELRSAAIEELANDVLYDEAYPELKSGIEDFVQRFLDAEETVLVLQGPPGTGKTRLIRAILGAISRKQGGATQALYTGDMNALKSDEIFVQFITGWHDTFIIEDADHLLKPRVEGNENLHRFLAIADGVVRAQGRKIIFSTNLPHVDDLDEALIRPGRCFARLWLRPLTLPEAEALLPKLVDKHSCTFSAVLDHLRTVSQAECSLADIYSAVRQRLE